MRYFNNLNYHNVTEQTCVRVVIVVDWRSQSHTVDSSLYSPDETQGCRKGRRLAFFSVTPGQPFNSLYNPSIIFWFLVRKCLLHRSGFGHQIAAAPAACYIAFFSLVRFKYGTLTHVMRSPNSVVACAHVCQAEGSGIDLRRTHLAEIALES